MPNNKKLIFVDELNLNLERKFEEERTLKTLRATFPSMNVLVAAEFAQLHARRVVTERLSALGDDYSVVGLIDVPASNDSDARVYDEFCARYPLLGDGISSEKG